MKGKDTMTTNIQEATLKLFHVVQETNDNVQVKLPEMVKSGILLVNENGIVESISKNVYNIISKTCGLKSINWAQSFHKSWDKVANATIEELIAEQIIHYIGTYGFESLGLGTATILPAEKILVDMEAIPAMNSFTVIKVTDNKGILNETLHYLEVTQRPHRDQIEYIKILMNEFKDNIDIDKIVSFELKIIFCDMNKVVPTNAQDFLRFMVYKASDGLVTTLVKDKFTIDLLSRYTAHEWSTVEQYLSMANLDKLAESFYRFKPLFLAFKGEVKSINYIINSIRRKAVKNHKPLSGNTISNVMKLLAENKFAQAEDIILKADIRGLVKLYNFVTNEYLNRDNQNRLYNIRNGKAYVNTEKAIASNQRRDDLAWIADLCKSLIQYKLISVFKDKTFYIPKGINYTVPTSEKQMMDVIPYGTSIDIPEDADYFCISGHWFNKSDKPVTDYWRDSNRVDLDFHMSNKSSHIGWNSNWRTGSRDILFSGDMTNAPYPNGAVESFRISTDIKDAYELTINAFNTAVDDQIPYELLFTKATDFDTDEDDVVSAEEGFVSAVVDVKNAIAPSLKLKVHGNSEVIGYYYNKSFTVYGGGIGNGRVPNTDLMDKALQASISRTSSMMKLQNFIALCGGKVVNEKPEDVDYFDLSTSVLTPTTLFDVVDGNLENLPLVKVVKEEEENN